MLTRVSGCGGGTATCSVVLILCLASGCSEPPTQSESGQNGGAKTVRSTEGGQCDCDRPGSFAGAVEQVRPAVVNLYAADHGGESKELAENTEGALRKMVPERRLVRSLGSGLIIDSAGRVVTNHHVVAGTDAVRARLFDDRWFETKLIGADPETDLALLKLVDANDLPAAPLGESSTLEVGDWVAAIGNPLGLNSTVTVGIASGIGRSDLSISQELKYQDFIQTDASINPGNSGGPLIDADGNVVGLNTAIRADAQGIGFAIPAAMVERVLPRLEGDGDSPQSWLGLFVEEVPDALRNQLTLDETGGVLVSRVVRNSPADRAGLAEGDVILEVDGATIEDVQQTTWLAGNLPTGEPVDVLIQRGAKRRELQLTPAEAPEGDAE